MEEHYINQFIINGNLYDKFGDPEYLSKCEFYIDKLKKIKGFNELQECFDYIENKLKNI